MAGANRRAILAALGANLGLAIAKLVGWMFTGASSMLAESVHSAADSTNQALLLWGGSAAARKPTPSHPFGHGRERYFWSFVVSLVIFSLGGLFALYEGIHRIQHPEPLESPLIAVAILVVGMVLEGGSLFTAVQEARVGKGDLTWWRYIQTSKEPELPVVLLEDLGALVGLMLALLGVLAAMLTGDGRFDAVGSIAIGILLLGIGGVLAAEMKSLLIGEAASDAHRATIRSTIEASPEVRRLVDMRTQHLGPDHLLIAARVEFTGNLDFEEISNAIDAVQQQLREAIPIASAIYLQPHLGEARRAEATSEAASVEE
jgi:cation diffusion facilitator family transporter